MNGELAAIGTALLFAFSSTFFTAAGRRAGASKINRSRLLLAALFALSIHWATMGHPFPVELARSAWYWLAISGVIGLVAGDELLFRAFVLIGPGLSMLIFALAPAIAACLSWIFFGESLSAMELLGIAVTLAGIAWVVTAPRHPSAAKPTRGSHGLGLLLAFGGAFGQAVGLVTAKIGLNAGAPPQSANTVRLVAAATTIWVVTVLTGRARKSIAIWSEQRRAVALTLCGAFIGPVAGVWLSLVAIEHAPIGVASTLMSLTPLFLLPIGRVVFHEPVTYRAVLGTIIALVGVALLLQ